MHDTENPYVDKVLRSATNAAAKVLADSLLHQRPLPIWKDGKVEYVLPTQQQIDDMKLQGTDDQAPGGY